MDGGSLSGQEPTNASVSLITPPKPDRSRKRLKLEKKSPATPDIAQLRKQISEHKQRCQEEIRDVYRDNLAELYFLQSGSNVMDFAIWRKKPNIHLSNYLKYYSVNPKELESLDKSETPSMTASDLKAGSYSPNTPVTPDVTHQQSSSSMSSDINTPSREHRDSIVEVTVDSSSTPSEATLVEQAKKEAQVLQRVAELRKQGLWSLRRLPKVQEPSRSKAHWDYLTEEMQWLAADFAQERRWKKAGCRKISRMILRYHQDRADDEKKAGKEESAKLRRIAGQIARQIKDFWSNIEKVVQYKHDSRLDEKRRQAMDMHLNFIVGQTEKYSSWLSEGLTGTTAVDVSQSRRASTAHSPISRHDGEFEPLSNSSDDEETIAREEEQTETTDNETDNEIAALQAEGEMSLDELLASLPAEVLEKPASLDQSDSRDSSADADSSNFDSEMDDGADDEETLVEQEQQEEQDYGDELKDLKDEGDMTVEELASKYAGAYASDFELPDTPSSSEAEEIDELSSEEEQEEDDANVAAESEAGSEDVGMEYLLHPEKDEAELLSDREERDGPNREITDIAAAALSLQPTGYTLETTVVKTPIPFLLKHTLREYQHVGLDWLATMYDRKLNGILADEMGLGKTIQTIALLAHLACEHSIWGPHLIVVPTSVMLNWELELKKWCPGFKILTYYGTPKERKLKRVGWTKTNAFHVCITSYKLVIQDHQAFKRKKWRYLILDEAQNIKNFKSQRWQTLLNFSSQRRLLLTGTPLQNNLMELWSLMHFLMPNVFQSHMDFKEWFANPVTGMIEGTSEYSEQLIRRLHKVLRPFLLRRLKADVERQLPKKYEHVVMCQLSKRQRFLYEEFMSRRATKDTLTAGNFMSVINILMQLRKVCNHPDMFDPRPIISPYETAPLSLETPASVIRMLDYCPLECINLSSLTPSLCDREMTLSAYASHRGRELQTPSNLIQNISGRPDPPARPPPTKLRPFVIRSPVSSPRPSAVTPSSSVSSSSLSITSTVMRPTSAPMDVATTKLAMNASAIKQEKSLSSSLGSTSIRTAAPSSIAKPQATTAASSQPITLQIHQTAQGTRLMIPSSQLSQLQAGFVHIIQTSTGQHLITSAANAQSLTNSLSTSTSSSKIVPISSISLAGSSASRSSALTAASVDPSTGRPVLRVAPMVASSVVAGSSSTTAQSSMAVKPATTTSSTAASSVPSTTPVTVVSKSVTNGVSPATSSKDETNSARPPVSVANRPKSTSVLLGPASRKRALESEARRKFEDGLKLRRMDEALVSWKRSQLFRIAASNRRNCSHRPVYGTDLHSVLDVWRRGLHKNADSFIRNSATHCYNVARYENAGHPYLYWNTTDCLNSLILTPAERLLQLKDSLERFVFVTPAVKTRSPRLLVRHSRPSPLVSYDELVNAVSRRRLTDNVGLLHPIQTRMLVQFPEKRLIQYDCGKLQTLDILLRRLKSGEHRVLIFTQMTRMLDVLEVFLNYHGHRYLRLDGTTKVEMRQALMDRFNADRKIFVFILSTRSGGIGVNLTGADTVIFYDSDWNPTMDAQAQDRCHRIGQTRDVHIYRLVSEMTIEENILKKANQKRLLGDVAIEGGDFTTAKLQQNTISDLFAKPSGLHSLIEEKQKADIQAYDQDTSTTTTPAPSVAPNLNEKQFEQALCEAEDDEDVKAAAVASEEAGAELAEFDETIPWDEREAELQEKSSKVETEIALLEKELTPVERYAVQFMEETDEQFSEEAVREAELDIEQAKRDWELNRLKEQRDEEERLAELQEDDMLYTYTKDDGMNQVFKDVVTGENMPMWCPPTPPRLENDVYTDQSMCFLYDSAVMTESQLPAVYIKKEKKRPKESHHQSGHVPKKKVRLSEELPQQPPTLTSRPPRSLFDRPNAALLKLRRDNKALVRHAGVPAALMKLGPGGLPKPAQADSGHQDQPEWLIHEDWSLLQAVQALLQLPLNLTVPSPAHIANWDLVSDIVSTTSRIYRSPKQCRLRYENVIIPREQGKLTYEANPPRKQQSKKVPKSVMYKTKGNKPMKTGQLYTQDSGSSVTTLHAFRFDCIKNVASKRTPTLRPTLMNSSNRNSQHASVVLESGINYDSPLNPEEVAKIRHDRIRLEKNKQVAEQQQRASQTARAASLASQSVQHLTPTGATAIISPAAKSALQASGVSIARTLPGSIVVNTPGTPAFSAINKRLTTQSTSVISGVTQVTQLSAGSRKMTVQEMQQLAARGNTTIMQRVQGVSAGTSGAPRTITVQQQTVAKSLTPSQLTQLNLFRQQQSRAAGAAGTTLVAQRVTAAGTSQLLTGQQTVMASGVPTLVKTVNSAAAGSGTVTLPVSGPVNINVSLAQQKALTTQQGKTTLTANQQQFRQIQLLHTGNKARPLTAQQKIGLSQHQLVGKAQGGSVQIVQQKIGGTVQQKLGIQQQIQNLIKQQQAQQQAQIITTPTAAAASSGTSAAAPGQTIIATTQLITPANMHATITKMATPTVTNTVTGGVSNVTVSLSRNLVASTSSAAAVSSSAASLVQPSASKVLATAGPRQQATAIAHRIGAMSSSTATGAPTSVVNLASVSLHNQVQKSSVSASIINKGLTVGGVQTLHPVAASPGTTILQTRAPATTATVLQQTIISSSKSAQSTAASQQPAPSQSAPSQTVSVATPSIALAPLTQSPAVVQIASTTPIITVDSVPVSAPVATTTITLPTTPVISAVSTVAASTPAATTSTPTVAATIDLQTTSAESSNESIGATPDPTRTYAMRPRKTN